MRLENYFYTQRYFRLFRLLDKDKSGKQKKTSLFTIITRVHGVQFLQPNSGTRKMSIMLQQKIVPENIEQRIASSIPRKGLTTLDQKTGEVRSGKSDRQRRHTLKGLERKHAINRQLGGNTNAMARRKTVEGQIKKNPERAGVPKMLHVKTNPKRSRNRSIKQ